LIIGLYNAVKVLRVMKYVVTHGHPQFCHSLRKKSQVIAETKRMHCF